MRRHPFTRRTVFGVTALLALAVAITIAFAWAKQARGQATPTILPLPPGAYTDCGKLGARHTIDLNAIDPVARWGYCAGNRADTDNCNVNRTSGRDKRARCAGEEYEIGQFTEALYYRTYGCDPSPGVPRLVVDSLNYWDTVFAVDVMLDLQCERCRACGLACVQCPSRPQPTPQPTPAPQPTASPPPQPQPTVT